MSDGCCGAYPGAAPVVLGLQKLAVAAAYYGAGRLGLLRELVVEGAVFTPIGPPTGVALAGLLIFGLRCWPGIALGAFLVIVSIGPLRPSVIGITVGNTAAPSVPFSCCARWASAPISAVSGTGSHWCSWEP